MVGNWGMQVPRPPKKRKHHNDDKKNANTRDENFMGTQPRNLANGATNLRSIRAIPVVTLRLKPEIIIK
jgi:hypothetical protein